MWKTFLFWLGVPCAGCPFLQDDHEKQDELEKYALRKEISRLRALAEREGINYGGSAKPVPKLKGI